MSSDTTDATSVATTNATTLATSPTTENDVVDSIDTSAATADSIASDDNEGVAEEAVAPVRATFSDKQAALFAASRIFECHPDATVTVTGNELFVLGISHETVGWILATMSQQGFTATARVTPNNPIVFRFDAVVFAHTHVPVHTHTSVPTTWGDMVESEDSVKTRAKVPAKTGGKKSAKTGVQAGVPTGAKTGVQAGVSTGAKTGVSTAKTASDVVKGGSKKTPLEQDKPLPPVGKVSKQSKIDREAEKRAKKRGDLRTSPHILKSGEKVPKGLQSPPAGFVRADPRMANQDPVPICTREEHSVKDCPYRSVHGNCVGSVPRESGFCTINGKCVEITGCNNAGCGKNHVIEYIENHSEKRDARKNSRDGKSRGDKSRGGFSDERIVVNADGDAVQLERQAEYPVSETTHQGSKSRKSKSKSEKPSE
jgi:hypothetical protein